jgi:hypothetical protein
MVSRRLKMRWVALVLAGAFVFPGAGLFGRLVQRLDAGLASLRGGFGLAKDGANPGNGGPPPSSGDDAGSPTGVSRASSGLDPSGNR